MAKLTYENALVEQAKLALDTASTDLAQRVRHFQKLQAERFRPLTIAERERTFRAELRAASAAN
jgi:hypothetical protein